MEPLNYVSERNSVGGENKSTRILTGLAEHIVFYINFLSCSDAFSEIGFVKKVLIEFCKQCKMAAGMSEICCNTLIKYFLRLKKVNRV